mgnify:CR=1 FL=1
MKSSAKPTKKGLLLVNLGSPAAPTPRAVRRYLAQFLHDYRVIDINRWLWCPLLHGIILNTRPRKVAKAYASIWGDDLTAEAPLIRTTRAQVAQLAEKMDDSWHIDMAMRYGAPAIPDQLDALLEAGCGEIYVFPLYPQYAGATTGTVYDEVGRWLQKKPWVPPIHMLGPYYDDPPYIQALAQSVTGDLAQLDWQPEVLLTSFHGLPVRYCKNGDPYYCHCHKSARLLAEALERNFTTDMPEAAPASPTVQLCFQSQFGPEQWLTPATDKTLEQLAHVGVKKVAVLCPGFSADCLETLEEIAVEGRESFLEAGGTHFHYIPCLNDAPAHIDLLYKHITAG